MRVLLTGFTPQQAGRGTRVKYEPVVEMIAKGLRDAGHEVDHRGTKPGEPLYGYDSVLVGLVPANSIAARHLYDACDVIYRARAEGCGLGFIIDDWQFRLIMSGAGTLSRQHDRIWRGVIKGKTSVSWAHQNKHVIETVVDALHERVWPVTVFPRFNWGDPSYLSPLPSRELIDLDVSAYACHYPVREAPDRGRARTWVMGTLSDRREWIESLGLAWDVDYVGSRASRAEGSVSEADLVQRYAGSWGVLSAPYNHAGSGWWRNRFVHAARAGAIVLADPREVRELGEPYLVDPRDVECADVTELRELADAQRTVLESWQSTAEEVQKTLTEVLERSRDVIQ